MPPDIFYRIMRFQGKTRRQVSNPCMTANDAIELANYMGEIMANNFLDLTNYTMLRETFQETFKGSSGDLLAQAIKKLKEVEEKNAEQAFILLQQEQITELVNTLQSLFDLQNGSPLPSYGIEYNEVMKKSAKLLSYWQGFYKNI